MPKKKTEETVEETVSEVTEVTEEVTEELAAAETQTDESAEAVETKAGESDESVEVVEAKADESAEVAEMVEAKAEESVEVEAKAETVETPKKVSTKKKAEKTEKVVEKVADSEPKRHKRAEKVGIVQSDKMTKTVTVRVDRVVKHPVYRKYVKRKKNFMAHDEKGAAVGDKVRIIETRPLSARKRWRVVEIIQKAEK